jgi:hypothetical protein
MKFELSLKLVYDVLGKVLKTERYIVSRLIKKLEITNEDHQVKTLAVDSKNTLYINQKFVEENINTEDDLACVLLHELCHLLVDDVRKIEEIKEEDPERSIKIRAMNMAQDIRINNFSISYLKNTTNYDTSFFNRFYDKEEFLINDIAMFLLSDAFIVVKHLPTIAYCQKLYCFLIYNSNCFNNYVDFDIKNIIDSLSKEVREYARDHFPKLLESLYLADNDKSRDLISVENIYFLMLEYYRLYPKEKSNTFLLGNHGDTDSDENKDSLDLDTESIDKNLKEDIQREIRINIKQIKNKNQQPGAGGKIQCNIFELEDTSDKINLDVFKKFRFDHIFKNIKAQTVKTTDMYSKSPVVPFQLSRSDAFLLSTGYTPLLWNTRVFHEEKEYSALPIYLDVSGSMNEELPYVVKLLANLDEEIDHVWGFSTHVKKITIDQLKKGGISSWGGTNFDCIVSHALEHKLKNILIITDGYAYLTSYPRNQKIDKIEQAIVLLTGDQNDKNNYFSKIYQQSYNLKEFTE